MLNRLLTWLIFNYPSDSANFKWIIKMIAIKLKLYKPNEYELACIRHNKKIKQKK